MRDRPSRAGRDAVWKVSEPQGSASASHGTLPGESESDDMAFGPCTHSFSPVNAYLILSLSDIVFSAAMRDTRHDAGRTMRRFQQRPNVMPPDSTAALT